MHMSRDSVGSGFGRRFYGMTRVLKQAPYAPHIKVGRWVFCFSVMSAEIVEIVAHYGCDEVMRWARFALPTLRAESIENDP